MISSFKTIQRSLRTAVTPAVIGVFSLLPSVARAQVDVGLDAAAETGLATTDIRVMAANIIRIFLGLLGIIAVVLMMYAGFTWMTAQGSEEKIQKAKQIMSGAVIGLAIILMSFAIVTFVVNSLREATGMSGLTGGGGCPPGQTCSFGGGAGGAGGFRITSVAPAGSGPSDSGWPKNYALSVWFNSAVSEASVTPASVEVRKCNARVSGGDPQPFDPTECGDLITGTRTVEGGKIIFKPDATEGENPTDFESDFWYSIRVQGGAVRDNIGRTLLCPFNPVGEAGDISSRNAQSDLCDRAAAFNDQRDVAPPTVTLDAPAPSPFCGIEPVAIHSIATDDFLVAGVEYLLDGGTAGLFDDTGEELAGDANSNLDNPFSSFRIFADIAGLAPGTHTVSAVASDGVPQRSAAAEISFRLNPPSCCDGRIGEGETAIDCGGECGSCVGSTCDSNDDCASGFCDETGRCANRPVIESVTPFSAGSGSLVTVRGRFFGNGLGTVTFMGGDLEGTGDDKVANPCAPTSWSDTEVVIPVPEGALTGPIRINTGYGKSDATNDSHGANLGSFTVNDQVLPGICTVSPNAGMPGSAFTASGSGFGATKNDSTVSLGVNDVTVAPVVGGAGGWAETIISLIVPPISERTHQLKVRVGGRDSNPKNFLVGGTGPSGDPRITAVSPVSGPVGSYVTVQGSSFGSTKGSVWFYFGEDRVLADEPICADNWKNNYVIVKVPNLPDVFQGSLPTNARIKLTTAAGKTSNEAAFQVNDDPPRPGICAVVPDNGRPGKGVQVIGEGFGSIDAGDAGPDSGPRFSVEFFKDLNSTVSSTAYSSWQYGEIGTIVAGDFTEEATWPKTGPVTVIADNETSSNSVPFTIGDCNAAGASCSAGTMCCPNGSCQDSCMVPPRASAYGWLFSTSVLPDYPMVVENSMCRAEPAPAMIQSPSPYKGSTDACRNAEVRVQFNRVMDLAATQLSDSLVLSECGEGAEPVCATEITGLQIDPRDCEPGSASQCRILTFTPPAAYNSGTSFFKSGTWYEVRLKSDVAAQTGFREPGESGRYLDGNKDRVPGGDYVFNFKTKTGDATCQLADVFVDPPQTNIVQDTDSEFFQALPTAANCNSLQCSPDQPYDLEWNVENAFLDLLDAPSAPPNSDACRQPVRAKAETANTVVRATMTPNGSRRAAVSGESDVRIKFAEPRVVEVTPVPACVEACINAEVSATFNVGMNPDSLTQPGNVEFLKCRNASCTAPYLPLGAVIRTAVTGAGESVNGRTLYKQVKLEGTGNLEPGQFYTVRIRGGENGVSSMSGALLGGLNDGEFYTWSFRTKDDPSVCSASRATIAPAFSTLNYIGELRDFSATPYGSPDACSRGGQKLLASSFSWDWSLDTPNRVIGGFVDGFGYTPNTPPPGSVVNTNSIARNGCTDRCLPTGSQNIVPQCGNGKVEGKYEECDTNEEGGSSSCTDRCVFSGTRAPACGDGVRTIGETCERVNGIFPPGCKQPGVAVAGFADDYGCIWTGSSTAVNSKCGDGLQGDGEACDDGNTAGGDGCSADCLKEGSRASCLDAPAGSCINYCGNGRPEVGEDPACENGPSPSALGCDPVTCLKAGSAPCSEGGNALCCGNGVVEKGETAICETDPDAGSFCTQNCLLKGSSAFYPQPSFCGDNEVGMGEVASCEQAPDALIDEYQVVSGQPQAGFDASSASGSASSVLATTAGIPDGAVGKAQVALSCKCGSIGDKEEADAFCGEFADGLACASNGCCAARPEITTTYPNESNSRCRNTDIRVNFNQVMDAASLEKSILVGYDNGTSPCPQGSTRLAVGDQDVTNETRGAFSRFFGAVADFFRSYVLRPVFGAAVGNPSSINSHYYCSVPADIQVSHEGSPAPTVSVAHVSIKKALPADTWIAIRVTGEAKSALGVQMENNAVRSLTYFGTSKDICTVERVTVLPASSLFSSTEENITYTATAHAKDDQDIGPTAEYDWSWVWTPQPAPDPATNPAISPIVVEPVLRSERQSILAVGHVRGSRVSDAPSGFAPKNGEAVVEASAVIVKDGRTSNISGRAGVIVMLCDNPWPARRTSDGLGLLTLPWNPGAPRQTGIPNTSFWFPYFDLETNVSLYYCRDVQVSGDSAALLPYLKETPAQVKPGRDILKEYLFTFDTTKAPPREGSGWSKDAVGFRINTNLQHYGVSQWYSSKGFKGAPAPFKVDGFDAIRDGRTVYVNNAAWGSLGDNRLYTNIYTISHNDGAAPETINIFGQVLANANFISNPFNPIPDGGICVNGRNSMRCVADEDCRVNAAGTQVPGFSGYSCDTGMGVCKDGSGNVDLTAGITVSCSADVQCRVGKDGKYQVSTGSAPVLLRPNAICDAPKLKMIRDVRRWGDLQSMRESIGAKAKSGTAPRLQAGTFLSSISVSTWPSWTDTLSSGVAVKLPTDPVNALNYCGENGRDQSTCWRDTDRSYVCNRDSHVYEYQYVQTPAGQDFRISADFEFGQAGNSYTYSWVGQTCIERVLQAAPGRMLCQDDDNSGSVSAAELANSICVVDGNECNFRVGKLYVGGSNRGPICTGTPKGEGNICGDGRVNPATEQCEPGQERAVQCNASQGGRGSLAEVCRADCQGWQPRDAGAPCVVGYCGDGVVRGTEVCDDGSLNGTYGHCSKSCGTLGFRCGDGVVQPEERCDCGDNNGKYFFDGILASGGGTCSAADGAANHASCSWDCSSPGPRCGDGLVQGGEKCDGEVEVTKGFCNNDTHDGCNSDADCPSGSQCGSFCPDSSQMRRRACNDNNPAIGASSNSSRTDNDTACQWPTGGSPNFGWTCTAAGFCGDGIKDKGEQCDDGNSSNYDTCKKNCTLPVCGDGYVHPALGETCDAGSRNGNQCSPEYGRSCSYCDTTCKTKTISGGFCGDNSVQSFTTSQRGPEQCDGSQDDGKYICVSNRPEYQSFGLRTGLVDSGYGSSAVCDDASCLRACEVPDSDICYQDCDYTNKLRDNFDINIGDDNEVWLQSCSSGNRSNLIAPGICGAAAIGNSRALCNACDPDDDNDGVPDVDPAECNPLNENMHAAYNISYTDINGRSGEISIPKAKEICDGEDNDCNGIADDIEPSDVVFLIDNSGSMDGEIDGVVSGLRSFVSSFNNGNHAFALVYTNGPGGNRYNPADHVRLNFTTNTDTFLSEATKMKRSACLAANDGITCGDGSVEKHLDVLGDLVTTNRLCLSWRPEVKNRIIVLMTDMQGQSATYPGCSASGEGPWCDGKKAEVASSVARYKLDEARAGINVQTWAFTTSGLSSSWQDVVGLGFYKALSEDGDTNAVRLKGDDVRPKFGPFAAVCEPVPALNYERSTADICAQTTSACNPDPCIGRGSCVPSGSSYTCVQ